MGTLESIRTDKIKHQTAEQRRKTPLVVRVVAAITLDEIHDVAVHHREITVAPDVLDWLDQGRSQLETRLAAGQVIYGINTGFGGNSNLVIPDDQLAAHQENLLTFLTAGTGEFFSEEYVRAAQIMTLLALVRGWSAVRPAVAVSLVAHINAGIVPNVPRFGSVGASGDLIPSSYIAGALCGRGLVRFNGQETTAGEAMVLSGIAPLRLFAKEGLALVNGTRMMTGVGTVTLLRFKTTFAAAVGALALAVHALRASSEHYDARIHLAKGHPGQIAVAAVLRDLLASSPSNASSATRIQSDRNIGTVISLAEGVQEIYSVRCAPQILGAVPESIESTRVVLEREAVSVNDNPLIDPENGDVLQGGNFMGHHVARAMDALKIDMALVANHLHAIMAIMMDCRFSRGLPNSLSPRLGLYQGFKGVQISQTSLVAQIRHDSGPSSVHTLATEQFNQDIVSLGLHAAQGAADIEVKLRHVVAMTLLAACQSVDLRGCAEELAPGSRDLYQAVRKISGMLNEDRAMDRDIAAIARAIVEGGLPVPQIHTAADAR
jgi:histidine ammonia-lyase